MKDLKICFLHIFVKCKRVTVSLPLETLQWPAPGFGKFKLKKKCFWMCQLLCGTRDPHCFIWGLSLQCTDSLVVAHGLSSCGARAPECAGFLPCMWAPWRPGSGSPLQSCLHPDSRHFCLFLRKAPKNYTLWFYYYKDEYISIRCFSIDSLLYLKVVLFSSDLKRN